MLVQDDLSTSDEPVGKLAVNIPDDPRGSLRVRTTKRKLGLEQDSLLAKSRKRSAGDQETYRLMFYLVESPVWKTSSALVSETVYRAGSRIENIHGLV
jgi:hypothetical protein